MAPSSHSERGFTEHLAVPVRRRSNPAISERMFHVRNIVTKLNLYTAPDDHRRVLAVLTDLRS